MSSPKDLLPNSIPHETKHIVYRHGVPWKPIYCANCGKDGGLVPEEHCQFAFYLCDSPCGEKWGKLAGTYAMPDEMFYEKVKQAQVEKYGRELTAPEVLNELKDPNSVLSILARDKEK